jgi:hypothetical protein
VSAFLSRQKPQAIEFDSRRVNGLLPIVDDLIINA